MAISNDKRLPVGEFAYAVATTPAKAIKRGAIRDNVEAFAVAILMAVLLKYFCLEAYMIPTSSMQPTMMGSAAAGVNDRILVDKIRYEIFEPKRWDITVFRYPIRTNQNYVKRCVGLSGDHLHIGAGNLYLADEGVTEANVLGDPTKLHALRKPAVLQERLWREIYPARRLLDGKSSGKLAGDWFHAPGWSEDGETLNADLGAQGRARLGYPGSNSNAPITNAIWDGYPTEVARAIRSAEGQQGEPESVQDLRFSLALECSEAPAEAVFEITVSMQQNAQKDRRFVLECKDGKGKLRALLGGAEVAASQPFDLSLVGRATLAFTHVDDQLVATRDGKELGRVDCDAAKILAKIPQGRVSCGLDLKGGGKVRIAEPRVEYDQHYTTGTLGESNLIVVPDGHYFMMGDNTLASADSREWTTIKVGVLPDGTMVDPKTHPEAKVLEGNKRAMAPSQKVDADENPVVLPARGMIAFTDRIGEVHALKSKIGPDYSSMQLNFGEVGSLWQPESHKTPFVPRAHILGRALMGFWPIPPAGPNRFGLIR